MRQEKPALRYIGANITIDQKTSTRGAAARSAGLSRWEMR